MTASKHILFSLLASTLLSCSGGKGFNAGVSKTESAKPADAAPIESKNSLAENGIVAETPQAAVPDQTELSEVAQEPAVVAGAFLHCLIAADEKNLACMLQDEKKVGISVASSATMQWIVVDTVGVRRVVSVTSQATTAGTYFFIPIPSAGFSTIQTTYAGSDILFDAKSLPADGTRPTRVAMPYLQPLDAGSASIGLGARLGDGAVATENNGTCNLPELTGAGVANQASFNTALNYAALVNIVVDGVCGLEVTYSYIKLQPQNGGEEVFVYLLPGVSRQLIQRGYAMSPGTFTISYGVGLLDNASDDWSAGDLFVSVAP